MSRFKKFKPTNRYLLVVPHTEDRKTPSGVLLPDDFEPETARFIKATVVSVASDCSKDLRAFYHNCSTNREVIVDKSMIEKVEISDKVLHLVLENYVLGYFQETE